MNNPVLFSWWMHHYSSRCSSCFESSYNLISLGTLRGEGFNFSSEGDLIKVFKEAHVKFQAEHVGNIYMLQNSEITVGGLQLFSASRSKVVKQSKTTMVSSSDVQFCSEGRLGLGGTGTQQGSPNRYSNGRANSHKSCIDQGDRWMIKFRSGLNLFDLIKLRTLWEIWRRGSEMEMKSRVIHLCIDVSTWSMVTILRLECIQVKGEIVKIVTKIHREGRQSFRNQIDLYFV